MMRRLLSLALIFVTMQTRVNAAETYRWTRNIQVPEIATPTLVAVPLDSHFFQFTRPGRPDVRLRSEKGQAVGFVIRAANERKDLTIRSSWTGTQSAARVDTAIGLQVELVLRDKDPEPTGIRIITPLRDFKHQVHAESSADGTTWTPTGDATVIFDYSRYVDARNDRIPISASGHRHFRITIDDITAEQQSQLMELNRRLRGGEETDRTETSAIVRVPFRIDRVEFYHDEVKVESGQRRKISYPADHVKVSANEKDHQTIVTFDSERNPITEIKILTGVDNFSRAAIVEAEMEDENGTTRWQKITSGTLTRFNVGAIQREDLTLSIREVGAARYRVIIDNRDSPDLAIKGVELTGPQYELIFLVSHPGTMQLEYGSGDAVTGQFDTAALEAALAQGQSVVNASLQSRIENPNALPDSAKVWMPWNDTRVLVAVILVATVVFSWVLFRASQRLTVPPSQ